MLLVVFRICRVGVGGIVINRTAIVVVIVVVAAAGRGVSHGGSAAHFP